MMTREHAIKLRQLIVMASAFLNDELALQGIELFPVWESDKLYDVGERIRYESTLYKCIQAHTSQADWTPDKAVSLWVEVSIDEFPAWKQPLGSQDAYRIGDKVSHLEKHWISTIDYNVYEPSVYGWDEVE